MMKDLYIFGHGRVALMVREFLSEQNLPFKSFIIDDEYEIVDSECIHWSDFVKTVSPNNCEVFVCLGYQNMNELRKIAINKIKEAGYLLGNFVHRTAYIANSSKFAGGGNILFPNVVIEPSVIIGEGNIFWSNSSVCHHTRIGSYNFFAASSTVLGCVKFGDDSFVGANAVIRNRVTVENKTLIGAGTYLYTSTKEGDVWVPSKSIKLSKKSKEIQL